jgi:histidyl-tRNA synthetase
MPSAKGFRDVLPEEARRISALETRAREILGRYGYAEVRLPTVELKELFVKSTGETSDIVEKEMFEWEDQGGRRLALRPEATPGICRLFIDEHLDQKGRAHRLFMLGSMFRAERPQAGRFREFEQIDAECIGIGGPEADAEMILMLAEISKAAGVKEFSVRLNTLGDETCRPAYREKLKAFLQSKKDSLCDNCKKRIDRNPLRALDCKKDGPILKKEAPVLEPCQPCAEHFARVQEYLKAAGFDKTALDPYLVRGLDYYSRTVFEFVSTALGAQDAFAAGGRYDKLLKSMGGPDLPAIGFAMGVERTLLAGDISGARDHKVVFVAVQKSDPALQKAAFDDLQRLRALPNITATAFGFGSNLGAQMKEADHAKADFVVIEGEEEYKAGEVTIRNFHTKEQIRSKRSDLEKTISDLTNHIKK